MSSTVWICSTPQLNYDGVSENYAQLELQIVPYLSALVFQLTGTMTPVVPPAAVYAVLFGLGLVPVPADARISGRWPALVGLGIYLFLPLSMMTAHVIQPEACALFFLLWRGCGCSGVSSRPGGWPSCGGPQP